METQESTLKYSGYIKILEKILEETPEKNVTEEEIIKYNVSFVLAQIFKENEKEYGDYELTNIDSTEFFEELEQVYPLLGDTVKNYEVTNSDKELIDEIFIEWVTCGMYDYVIFSSSCFFITFMKKNKNGMPFYFFGYNANEMAN